MQLVQDAGHLAFQGLLVFDTVDPGLCQFIGLQDPQFGVDVIQCSRVLLFNLLQDFLLCVQLGLNNFLLPLIQSDHRRQDHRPSEWHPGPSAPDRDPLHSGQVVCL